MRKLILVVLAAGAMVAHAQPAPEISAADQAAELAKKLANPVAALISVPLQYNYDEYGGENDGASKSVLNIQPVVPLLTFNLEMQQTRQVIMSLLGG